MLDYKKYLFDYEPELVLFSKRHPGLEASLFRTVESDLFFLHLMEQYPDFLMLLLKEKILFDYTYQFLYMLCRNYSLSDALTQFAQSYQTFDLEKFRA